MKQFAISFCLLLCVLLLSPVNAVNAADTTNVWQSLRQNPCPSGGLNPFLGSSKMFISCSNGITSDANIGVPLVYMSDQFPSAAMVNVVNVAKFSWAPSSFYYTTGTADYIYVSNTERYSGITLDLIITQQSNESADIMMIAEGQSSMRISWLDYKSVFSGGGKAGYQSYLENSYGTTADEKGFPAALNASLPTAIDLVSDAGQEGSFIDQTLAFIKGFSSDPPVGDDDDHYKSISTIAYPVWIFATDSSIYGDGKFKGIPAFQLQIQANYLVEARIRAEKHEIYEQVGSNNVCRAYNSSQPGKTPCSPYYSKGKYYYYHSEPIYQWHDHGSDENTVTLGTYFITAALSPDQGAINFYSPFVIYKSESLLTPPW